MNGLMLATVCANQDKDHPGMVMVTIPAMAQEPEKTLWARIATPYGGKQGDGHLLPGVGDSVVVGFLEDDNQEPIALGSFLNQVNGPPEGLDGEEVEEKPIFTKGGHTIRLTDGDGLLIQSGDGHTVSISEEEESILVTTSDKKHSITLDQKGKSIAIQSSDTISIRAKDIVVEGNVKMKGNLLSLESTGELSLKGSTLKSQSNSSTKISGATVEISGVASTKVTSSSILELKGSLTKIN